MIYIILPSFNEEKNLIKIIKKIEFLNKKLKTKVILVDDGSNDATGKIAKKKYNFKIIYLKHKTNKGLSVALESGFKKVVKIGSKKDIVITLDSDNTHPIDLIPKMKSSKMPFIEGVRPLFLFLSSLLHAYPINKQIDKNNNSIDMQK